MTDGMEQEAPIKIPHVGCGADLPTAETMPSDDELKALFGTKTPETARALFGSALMALGEDASSFRKLAVSINAEEQPKSAVEAMLLLQIVTTHAMVSRLAMSANFGDQVKEHHMKMLTSALTTFTRQVETLRRLRANGAQTVRIEHVHVNQGGQAIVGQVTKGGEAKHDEG